jgi:TonB family protein
MNFFRSACIHLAIVAAILTFGVAVHQVKTPVNVERVTFVPALPVPTVRPVYHTSATGGHASPAPLPAVAVTKLAVGSPRAATVQPASAQPAVVTLAQVDAPALPVAAGPVVRTVTRAGFGQQSAINGSNRVGMGVVSGGFGQGAGTGNGHGNGVVKLAAFSIAQEPVRAAVRALPDTSPAVVYSVPKAFYSQAARAANVTGDVVLKVRFSADGTVEVLDVVQSPGYGLDSIARQVATGIAFKPAVKDGQAVDSIHTVTVQFQLL